MMILGRSDLDRHSKIGAATLVSGVALTCMLGPPAFADVITMQVYAAEAPNAFGSPSYNGWAANAITAVEANQSSAGTPGTPTYFQEVTTGTDTSNIVTSFPSWNGGANPGGAFSSELGNRLTFILVAKDTTGPNISLSELTAVMSSSDPSNTFGFSTNWANGNPISNYSANQIGLITTGPSSPSTITSGSPTQLVNELVVVGVGNALANTGAGNPCSVLSGQAAVDCVKGQYDALIPFNITTTYSLAGTGASGSASVAFVPDVPEPGTLALFGSAVAGLGLIGRRRKKA
jgi:hypothetical protein